MTALTARTAPVAPHGTARSVAVGLGVGVVLWILAAWLVSENWMRGEPWQPLIAVQVVAKFLGAALALGVGVWWWWRAPANPTGRLLYIATLADIGWLISRDLLEPVWLQQLAVVQALELPCLVLIVLGWPTGRPSRHVRRIVLVVAIAGPVVAFASQLFARSEVPSARFPDPAIAVFVAPEVYRLLDAVQALCFRAVPAVALIVALVRRRRAVPPAIRPTITPLTVAGVILAASYILQDVGYQLFGALLLQEDGPDMGIGRFVVLMGTYCSIGIVAVGVLVGANRRLRAVRVSGRRLAVDLSSAAPVVSPSTAVAALVGDPSAAVRYPRPGGGWVDSAGAAVTGAPGRRRMPVFADDGEVIAALEVSDATPVPALLADLASTTIAARSASERAAALAGARRAEMSALSRAVVDATDRARADLERTLHDGAQQLVVGLALTAGLAARDDITGGSSGSSAGVVEHIVDVRRSVLNLVDSATPAVLVGGLAGALSSLAATCPVPTAVSADGDLAADEPLAVTLYLAAGDALANAVKHSGADRLRIGLTVDDTTVRLTVADNGVGGMSRIPASLAARAATCDGWVEVDSPDDGGTVVTLTAERRVAASR